MSTNSSFNSHPLLHLNLSSTNSSSTSVTHCFMTIESVIGFASFFIIHCVVIMPISVVIFSLGLRRWFQQWFESRPSTVRHSDAFIYHMAAIEILGDLGCMMILYGVFQNQPSQLLNGYNIYSFGWYGETLFYLLTCMEHYLAVVHPVTYRNLQKERKIRIRNTTIGCVWLFNLGKVILVLLGFYSSFFDLFTLGFLLISLCFSSLSILSVLTGSVVAEQGKKSRLKRSKKRAFYTIIVIQAALFIKCVTGLTYVMYLNIKLQYDCFLLYVYWLNLPCSLALPLFFLQRIGRTTCYSNNARKNQG